MSWDTELAFYVTPRSGPLRAMRTLGDVRSALMDDLAAKVRWRPHWKSVAQFLLSAESTGSALSVRLVSDSLFMAVEHEGWMEADPELAPAPAPVLAHGWRPPAHLTTGARAFRVLTPPGWLKRVGNTNLPGSPQALPT